MAQAAYDLQRFEPSVKQKPAQPRVRVSKAPKLRRRRQMARAAKIIAMCSLVLVLVTGVLSTHAGLAEIQVNITRMQKQIEEEEALNTYLNGQLGDMVNLRNIEEKAKELGLVKMDASKVNYIRVEDGSHIEVRQSTLEGLLQGLWGRVTGLFSSTADEE